MKLLVVSLLAATAVMAGCSSSKSSTPAVELNNALPNGVWNVVEYDYADENQTLFTARGSVIITPTDFVEYYDFDGQNGSESVCNLDFDTKFDNGLVGTATDRTFDFGWTATLVATSDTTMTVSFIDDAGTVKGTVKLDGRTDYATESEADLDARLCSDEIQDTFPNGIWKKVTNDRWHEDGQGNYVDRPAFGGVIVTDGKFVDFGSHLFDDNEARNDGERCYHTGEATFKTWPNTFVEYPDFTGEWTGSFEAGAVLTTFEYGRKDEANRLTYVGPATTDATAALKAEFSNICTHGNH